jgi:hypothetical protein
MDIPLAKYVYVCWMATWGSFAAFLQKYASGEIGKDWANLAVHAVKDIVNANLAAILVFWTCRHFGAPAALEAISYTLAGYGGARTMEYLYKKWVSTAGGAVTKITGIPDAPEPEASVAPMEQGVRNANPS